MKSKTFNFDFLIGSKFILLVLLFLSLSSCRIVDGQDAGVTSQGSVILSTMVISATCSSQSNIAQGYSCQPTVTIPSDQSKSAQLTWELTSKNTCSWVQINPTTGQVFGTPGISDFHSCALSFHVQTTGVPASDYSLAIQVQGPVINLTKQNCSTTVGVQSPVGCTVVATSNYANSIFTYSLASDNTCSWIMINSATGVLSGTPLVANEGSCVLSVNSAFANYSTANIKIPISVPAVAVSVTAVNCPSTAPIQSMYSCTLQGSTNLNGHTITWSLSSANTCAWASIDPASGAVTGTPPLSAQGNCNLSISANLENLAMGSFATSITIPAVPVTPALSCNLAPPSGTAYSCQASASAPIQNPTFTWMLSPQNTCRWAAINTTSGLITGTAAIQSVGPCVLGVTANLGLSTGSQSLPLTVGIAGYTELDLASAQDRAGGHAGFSVDISGNWAVVGSPATSNNDGSTGIANIFFFNGTSWQRSALLAPPSAAMMSFGYSVAISGSVVMVGAPDTSVGGAGFGAVIVYQYNGTLWSYSQTISPPSNLGGPLINFGSDIHIDSDGATAIVATSHYQCDPAYILQKSSNWNITGSLAFSSVGSYDGPSRIKVGIENGVAVVADSHFTSSSPSVHVFRNNSGVWGDEGTLNAGSSSNGFGSRVVVGGGRILVGAAQETGNQGAAYLFEHGSTWTNTARFSAIDPTAGQFCGSSLALDATTAVIGCPSTSAAGSAYAFNFSGGSWSLSSKFVALASQSGPDAFGSSLAIFGNNIIVGADLFDPSNAQTDSGAAFMMTKF